MTEPIFDEGAGEREEIAQIIRQSGIDRGWAQPGDAEKVADAILALRSSTPSTRAEPGEDEPWPESPLATDLFRHVQSQYSLDNDEASEEAGEIIAILVKHGVDPTKLPQSMRAEAEPSPETEVEYEPLKHDGFYLRQEGDRLMWLKDGVASFWMPYAHPAADADKLKVAVDFVRKLDCECDPSWAWGQCERCKTLAALNEGAKS